MKEAIFLNEIKRERAQGKRTVKRRWKTKKGDRNCGLRLIATHPGVCICLASCKQKRYYYFRINVSNDCTYALILQNLEGKSCMLLQLLWQVLCINPTTLNGVSNPVRWAVVFTLAVCYQERHQEIETLCYVRSSNPSVHMPLLHCCCFRQG